MLKLTDRFGNKFWRYVVFVHTFANEDDDSNDSDTESVDVNELSNQYKLDKVESF